MVTLLLDRERHLGYPWASVKRLRAEQGINMLAFGQEGDEDRFMEPEWVSKMLWGALIAEEPGLSVEQVDGMITMGGLPRITQAIAAAMDEALKEGRQEQDPTIGSTA